MEQDPSIIAELAPPAAEGLSEKKSHVWLLLTLATVFLLALPSLRYPIGRDQATHCVIATGLLKGKQMYRDLWDNRPPGIYYLYMPLVSIFGRVMWMIGVVDVLYLVVIGFFIFRFTKRYLGAPAGLMAAVLYTLWHEHGDYESAAQPETFIVLLVFIADYLLMRKDRGTVLRHAAAGVLFGAVFWIKYNAGLFLVPGFFLPYLDTTRLDAKPWRLSLTLPWKTWFKRVAVLSAGFMATVVLPLGYFWLNGVWRAFVQVQLVVLPRYAAMILERKPEYGVWALSTISINLRPWVEASVAIALAVAWWRRELGRLAPIFLLALTGFLVTTSQLRFNSYYFETCLPFVAMICAYVPVALWAEFRVFSTKLRRRKMTLARVLLWVAFANIVYFPLPRLALTWIQQAQGFFAWVHNPEQSYEHYWWPEKVEHLRSQLRVIRYIKTYAGANDQIFVWGTAPLIYYLADKEPPNRFVTNLALISAWGPESWRQELVRDLEHSPPRFIIVARHDAIYGITYTPLDSAQYLREYPGLARILQDDYQEVRPGRNFLIYRLRPAGRASS